MAAQPEHSVPTTHTPGAGTLAGIRVIELADEQAEYCGLTLAGLGAEVIKVEPPGGNSTRRIGPFYEDKEDPERSLFFWYYNRGKKSLVLDLQQQKDRDRFRALVASADILLESTPKGELDKLGMSKEALAKEFPTLIHARVSPFGDDGPWSNFKASDLVHLALGGVMMNCGYDPDPSGKYDLPPIAPQMWHAYHVAGEQLSFALLAALLYRFRTGKGQLVSCAVHESVSKSTEVDLMTWVMRRALVLRQTCRHARESVAPQPSIAHTKDGRWVMASLGNRRGRRGAAVEAPRALWHGRGLQSWRRWRRRKADASFPAPVRRRQAATRAWRPFSVSCARSLTRTFRGAKRRNWECSGRRSGNLTRTPSIRTGSSAGASRTSSIPSWASLSAIPTSKWISTANSWVAGRRAPLLNEDAAAIEPKVKRETPVIGANARVDPKEPPSKRGKPFPLHGIRIVDFSWFLASAGGTRFLSAFGAESIKIELKTHPDTRLAAMAPVGGREARDKATGPLPGVTDINQGGQFNNKNPGQARHLAQREASERPRDREAPHRHVGHRRGRLLAGRARQLGPGLPELKKIKKDIIYVQQSGMGGQGTYGRFRTVGPIANAFAGLSEMSGLPEPAMPAGWGYSYLDWMGAFSFSLAMLSALFHRERTGEGQWIDASQTEVGLFINGPALLDWSANGRVWTRIGNRSPWKPAAPHNVYPCAGDDRWITIACFTEAEWNAFIKVAEHPEWGKDPRFATLAARLAHQEALDALIKDWTKSRDAYQTMHALQQAGVPAGVCQHAGDRCDNDPQLKHARMADRGDGHEDRPVADRRGADQAERESRLHRRAHRPRRADVR